MASAIDYFPHQKIRSGQDLLLADLEKALAEKKILIAHAPTGLGKTACALACTLHEALDKKHEKKKVIFFLTNRHTQHQIAVNTLKMVKSKTGKDISCVDIIGKRWMCNQEVAGLFSNEFNEYCKTVSEKGECEFYNNVKQKKDLTVEARKMIFDLRSAGPLHNEEVISLCKDKKFCSYEISLGMAKDAAVIIGDYYYLFNPHVRGTLFNRLGLSMEDVIVIVDEGHNLPNRVAEMLSSSLTSFMLKNAILEAKKFGFNDQIAQLSDLNNLLNEMARFQEREREKIVSREDFISGVSKFVDYENFMAGLELSADEVRKKQRKSFLGGISSFLENWYQKGEHFARIIAEKENRYGAYLELNNYCLDPSVITKEIFGMVHAGVMMSGTLRPTFMYKDLLGIEKGVEKEYLSPFPPENKLSLVIPETTTKYSSRTEEMFKLIAKKCSELSELIPGNMAFFFPSYDLRDKISVFIETSKKLFWEKREMNKEEKENFLEQFKSEKKWGGVLLGVAGANFAEGIDLPGDLLNGVVVVGLPLARPDLMIRKMIEYYDSKFRKGWSYGYIYPAMSKCIQSAGRCIRSETDRGTVIYLEERFVWPDYFCCIPQEGLKVTKDYSRLLKEFFGANNSGKI